MTTPNRPPREIDGKGRTICELLAGRKYSIDYYQREYKWQQKQVTELIDDLASKFLESHEEGNERSAVAEYGHYFLGSIIVSDKDGQKFIIDGQQRLTTLTLLLVFLQHRLADHEQKGQLADLILSQKYGQRSFNLDVPERTPCMEALYAGEDFSDAAVSESVVNILARYADLIEQFPEDVAGAALPYFVDWLIENVHLIESTAYSDGDAYTIFETMNDRGLSLTPADMLKGYLLANISDTELRTRASRVWKKHMQALIEIGKEEDADGIKSWLRSQYAKSIRERKRGAAARDFDLIGTEFHRWVRDNRVALGLTASPSSPESSSVILHSTAVGTSACGAQARFSRPGWSVCISTPGITSPSSTWRCWLRSQSTTTMLVRCESCAWSRLGSTAWSTSASGTGRPSATRPCNTPCFSCCVTSTEEAHRNWPQCCASDSTLRVRHLPSTTATPDSGCMP